jgi:hypothetical protein
VAEQQGYLLIGLAERLDWSNLERYDQSFVFEEDD